MLYTNDRYTIRFDGGVEVSRPWLAANSNRAQRVLRNHSAERAQCLCTPVGVPMHIVCRGGTYFLATMPGRGHHHALSCPSYIPDETTSGLRHYSPTALSRANGLIKVQVRPERPGDPPFDHFSPDAALQFLWELAGLTMCTPKTVSARNYQLVARSLADAAANLRINTQGIRPYIPLCGAEPNQSRYVIGQIRQANHAKYANALHLSADRENTFWVDEKNWTSSALHQYFGDFEAPSFRPGVFMLAKLWQSPQGNYRIFEVGLLPTSKQYLPAPDELRATLDQLIAAERRFFVCQRFDARDDQNIPAAVLIDSDEPKNLFLPCYT